jgi:hypothetical protein
VCMERAASWQAACLLRCSHKQKDYTELSVTLTLQLVAEEHTSVAGRAKVTTDRRTFK